MTDTTTRRPPAFGIIRGARDHPELDPFPRLEGSTQRLPDTSTSLLGETIVYPVASPLIRSFRAQWTGDVEPHPDGTALAVLRVIGVDPIPTPEPEPEDYPDPDPEPEPELPNRRPIPDRLNRYQTLRQAALRAAVEFLRDLEGADEDDVLDTAMAWERWLRTGKDPRTRLDTPDQQP